MSIIMIGIYCYRHALIHAVFVCSSYYYRWLNHYQCNMLKQLLFLSRPISNIMANILYALKNILIHHSNMESPFTNFFSFYFQCSCHNYLFKQLIFEKQSLYWKCAISVETPYVSLNRYYYTQCNHYEQ